MSSLSSVNLDANYNYIDEVASGIGSYFGTQPYIAYGRSIETAVHTAAKEAGEEFRGLCIREIHACLGDTARPAWTLDALSSLSGLEEIQSGGMRRWRPVGTEVEKPEAVPNHGWTREGMGVLFDRAQQPPPTPHY